jgi:alpha-ribazole phosphatase
MMIHLIRHTRPQIAPGVCYGHLDVELADTFGEELAALRQKLAGIAKQPLGWVVTSPLKRCQKLAEALSEGPVQQDNRLMELDFGVWEGQPWGAIDPDLLRWWSEDVVARPCPQGESYADLYRRSIAALEELQTLPVPQVTVITHAGVIRALLGYALGIPLQDLFQITMSYGSCTTLIAESTLRIGCVNC